MLARGNAKQLLKISSSKVESLEAENRHLELAQAEVAERDAVIHALERRLAKECETFKAAVTANTERTCQLHDILIKVQKGKFVDADTAQLLEDLQKRNTKASVSRKRATSASSPPSAVQTSPAATKAIKDDRPPELVDLTSDVELSSSPEDSPQAVPSAEKDSRDPVPPPTGGKTVPEAPAPAAEASSVTKKIPDSGPPGSLPHKATPSAGQGDENEGTTFHDLVALSGSDDEDEDPPRSAQASSSSAARRPSGVTSPYRSSAGEDDSSDDEVPRDPSIAKRPSLPSLPPSTPMEVDDDGGRSRKDAGGDMSPRSTSLPVILLAKKLFLPQPRVKVQLVVLETLPRLHDLVFLVAKVLQLIPAVQVQMKER
ncbi:hypothetical protein JG688_00012575 [Phytophthora aleatoria]|uniref:Uncharacterized protein n=1 Tax=Phytophthora aleatoria TaxID=2496075 RepID=A0A8J5LZS0_9STRA|nr:hypothetical protein JG688_00012575 [Phytophthora aleatoria]